MNTTPLPPNRATRVAPTAVLAALLGLGFPLVSFAADSPLQANIAVTSDYLFRGISQNEHKTAVQAGMRWQHESGVYVAGWASTIDFGDGSGANAEVDAVIGFVQTLGDHAAIDVGVTRYLYPGARSGEDLDYNEAIATLNLGDRWAISAAWSPDVFASGHDGTWLQAKYTHPLSEHWSAEAAAARYAFDGGFEDYNHGLAGVVYSRNALQWRATLHDTSATARRAFGAAAARERVEFSVNYEF